MVNTWTLEPGTELYVLPSQCEQVFYSYVLGTVGWSYVVIYDPKGRRVKYNVLDNNDIEEEDDVKEQVDVLHEENEEVELDVDGNFLDDHIDDEIIENGIDYDVAMPNPFNFDSKLYFESDDTDLDLDEEQDQ